ncbi:MAG: hypothetical protein ACQERZ_08845 [Fusobacteriota bacterium]
MILAEKCKVKGDKFTDYICLYKKNNQIFFNDMKITPKQKDDLVEKYKKENNLEIIDIGHLTLEQGVFLDKEKLKRYVEQKRGHYDIYKTELRK